MTLIDAGPMIALINSNDQNHRRCAEVLERLQVPFVTTWPALTEAMHLLGGETGWSGQEQLLRVVLRGDYVLHPFPRKLVERARLLMGQYASVPMGLADATLVATAEDMRDHRIFTLDSDFRIYRYQRNKAFEIIP
jgi:predicted nucleic acid-binding protein